MLTLIDESTVLDEAGRYRFLSENTFCELTKAKDRCFVCLTASGEETQEHVIPNWIIKLCGLGDKTLTLSNGRTIPYPRYKVPCCESCNQGLRAEYEDRVSAAMKMGVDGLRRLHQEDPTLLIRWLNLLFFKTHYKDLFLRRNLDHRSSSKMIGDVYDWGVMGIHHALFRSSLFDVDISVPYIGSLIVTKVLNPTWAGLWDYRDDYLSKTIYVRIGDVALIGVLSDGAITSHAMKDRFCVDSGAYVAQTLEMLTDYQVFNLGLQTKPDYVMHWKLSDNQTGIRVDLPERFRMGHFRSSNRHRLLWSHLKRYQSLLMSNGQPLKRSKHEILSGRTSLALNPKPSRFPVFENVITSIRSGPDTAIFYGS